MAWQRRDLLASVTVGFGTALAGCSDGDPGASSDDSNGDSGTGSAEQAARDCVPVARTAFSFEYDTSPENGGRLTITHEGGDILSAEDVQIRGEGFTDLPDVDMTGSGAWSGDTKDGQVSAGHRLHVGVTEDYRIAIVHRVDGQDLGILSQDDGPEAGDWSAEEYLSQTPEGDPCPVEGITDPAIAQIEADFEPAGEGTGTVTFTHEGGDTMSVDRLSVRGEGFADVAGADLTSAGSWPGSDDVSAGSTVTVGATADCVIHLVWEAEETSSVLTTFDGPER